MPAVDGIDQLCRDANPVAGLAHAAFQDIADTQFLRHDGNGHGTVLVDEG